MNINYRPISNLKYLGKVIERVVSSRLKSYLNEHNLQNPFQSAYRQMHSVESALLRVKNDILMDMDSGKISGLVLLDLSSAFNRVDHSILLDRLKLIGINGLALQWLSSYLSDRSQSVCLPNASSSSVNLNFSVPQGSVLGPQLFNIYTQPLQGIIQDHGINYHMYADDLQLYFSCQQVQEDIDGSMAKLEACVSDIQQWMVDSYLKLNEDKTEFIVLGSKRQLSKITPPLLHIGSSSVSPVEQAHNLGVILNSSMSLESQISNCVKLANYNLRNIRSIRQYLNPVATEQLIHAFVTSYLDNCNSLLFGLPKNQII